MLSPYSNLLAKIATVFACKFIYAVLCSSLAVMTTVYSALGTSIIHLFGLHFSELGFYKHYGDLDCGNKILHLSLLLVPLFVHLMLALLSLSQP